DRPQRVEVADLLERALLATHLLVDAVDVLRTAAELGTDARRVQRATERVGRPADELLAFGAPLLELARQRAIGIGLEEPEGEILELPLQLPQAEPVRQRCQHVERLACDR